MQPDERLQPGKELFSRLEVERGLRLPVEQYALLESAFAHARGCSMPEQRRDVAELWARFSAVAVQNPDAWDRTRHGADELLGGSAHNRMLAFPYAKLHASQWNVDQAAELGLPLDRPLTETGGMPFAGGPLNSFVLQALAKLVGVLRRDPGTLGLLNAISGSLTKQGVSLWSTRPAARGFRFEDVSAEASSQTAAVPVRRDAAGEARIAGYTVTYENGVPTRGIALCVRADTTRALAVAGPELAGAMTQTDFCGRSIALRADGSLAA